MIVADDEQADTGKSGIFPLPLLHTCGRVYSKTTAWYYIIHHFGVQFVPTQTVVRVGGSVVWYSVTGRVGVLTFLFCESALTGTFFSSLSRNPREAFLTFPKEVP